MILLVEKEDVIQNQEYRSICLLNVSFKVFTEVAKNQITGIDYKVVRPTTQTIFMLG
jgi:hypothetical protein